MPRSVQQMLVQQTGPGDVARVALITSSPSVPADDDPAHDPPMLASVCDSVSPRRHRLTDDEVGAFLDRARGLGHDPGRLLAGEAAETLTGIPTPRADAPAQHMFHRPSGGPARRASSIRQTWRPGAASARGVHDWCEAYVFADGIADDADRAGLALHLPFPARRLVLCCTGTWRLAKPGI